MDTYDNVTYMRSVRMRAKAMMSTDDTLTYSTALEMALDAIRAEGN